MEIIEFKNVSLGYNKGLVLEKVNMEINSGDFLLIVGENGSGKTTLIKGLLGLIPTLSGEIIKDEACEISYISQGKTGSQDFPASVFEIVLSGRLKEKKNRTFYNKTDKDIAEENMVKLNISSLKNKAFKNLSGGQKQRVLLARALTAGFDILVLDEPTTGLDKESRFELYSLLVELNESYKKTIILISHEDKKDYVADLRTFKVRDGRVEELLVWYLYF